MEWRDQGALLAVRRHGETAAIIEVFTAAHGRHAGVVRGGASRKVAPVLQPGGEVEIALPPGAWYDLNSRQRLAGAAGVVAGQQRATQHLEPPHCNCTSSSAITVVISHYEHGLIFFQNVCEQSSGTDAVFKLQRRE